MHLILIIDDDPVCANLYRHKFKHAGFEVAIALTGEEGLDQIWAIRPSAVLLDVMLPKIQGIDLLRQIRAIPEFADLPVIVFTNAYLPKVVQNAENAGATRVLNKAATNLDLLIGEIKSFIANTSSRAQEPAAAPSAPSTSTDFIPLPAAANDGLAAFRSRALELLKQFSSQLSYLLPPNPLGEFNPPDEVLASIFHALHQLSSGAALNHLQRTATCAAVTQAYVSELSRAEAILDQEAIKTLTDSRSLLQKLSAFERPVDEPAKQPAVLVLDDDIVSGYDTVSSLGRAQIKSDCLHDSSKVIPFLTTKPCDLLVINARMKGMENNVLYHRIRQIGIHVHTPALIQVPAANFSRFDRHKLAAVDDIIPNPASPMHLALKALRLLLIAKRK